MTETWVFARGRWRVITERGLGQLIASALLMAFATGLVCSTLLVDLLVRYEVKRQFAPLQREVDDLARALRRARP